MPRGWSGTSIWGILYLFFHNVHVLISLDVVVKLQEEIQCVSSPLEDDRQRSWYWTKEKQLLLHMYGPFEKQIWVTVSGWCTTGNTVNGQQLKNWELNLSLLENAYPPKCDCTNASRRASPQPVSNRTRNFQHPQWRYLHACLECRGACIYSIARAPSKGMKVTRSFW